LYQASTSLNPQPAFAVELMPLLHAVSKASYALRTHLWHLDLGLGCYDILRLCGHKGLLLQWHSCNKALLLDGCGTLALALQEVGLLSSCQAATCCCSMRGCSMKFGQDAAC
jgi:hypothetical protein